MKRSLMMLTLVALATLPFSCKTTSNVNAVKDSPDFVDTLDQEGLPPRVGPDLAKERFGRAYLALKAAGHLTDGQELCFRQTGATRGIAPAGASPCGIEFIRTQYTNIGIYNVHLDSLDSAVLIEGFSTEGPNHFSMKSERGIYDELATALGGNGTSLSQEQLPAFTPEAEQKAALAKVYDLLKSQELLSQGEDLCFFKLARARGISRPDENPAVCGRSFIQQTFVNIDLYRVHMGSLQGPVVLEQFTTNGNPHMSMKSEQEIYDILAGALAGGDLSSDPLDRRATAEQQKAALLKVYNKLKSDQFLAAGDELCFKYLSTARSIGPLPAADCGVDFIQLEFVNINSYRVHLNSLDGPLVLERFTTNGPSHMMMQSEQEIYDILTGALR